MKVNAVVDMVVVVIRLKKMFQNQAIAIVVMIAVVKISKDSKLNFQFQTIPELLQTGIFIEHGSVFFFRGVRF